MLEACYRARRAGHAARLRHRQLRPGDAACRRRGAEPRRHEQGEVDRARPRRAEAGAILAEIDRQTRPGGQEIRLHPSTYNTASIGGFIAGGSGGVGSISWGGLRNIGNVLGLRVVTMEEKPRVLELTGRDLLKVMHAYGTNGIITEVEMPLDAAYDWVDVIVGFDDYMEAVRFAEPHRQRGRAALQGDLDGRRAGAVRLFPPPQEIPEARAVGGAADGRAARDRSASCRSSAREGAEMLYRSDTATEAEKKGLPPLFELTWNHTTLRGLRVDPTITYLQVLYPFPTHVESVAKMTKIFGDEVPGHLEFQRFDGNICCSGLPIVRFTTEERLDEIVKIHEDNGCPIFNPHRYTLEEGGMKRTDEVQLAFKREADPKGLLNPGKMIAWENPDYDWKTDKVYLFPGLQQAAPQNELEAARVSLTYVVTDARVRRPAPGATLDARLRLGRARRRRDRAKLRGGARATTGGRGPMPA